MGGASEASGRDDIKHLDVIAEIQYPKRSGIWNATLVTNIIMTLAAESVKASIHPYKTQDMPPQCCRAAPQK